MRDELERFVASLAIPADRKAIVLAELSDHAACAAEAAARAGEDPAAAARAAIGELEALRRSLEAIEPAFRISRARALGHGVVAAVLIVLVLDRTGAWVFGALAALATLAIAVALAPPHLLELLRAELRAPRLGGAFARGVPIGPALVYLFTVMGAPMAIGFVVMAVRARGGVIGDTPPCTFAVAAAASVLLAVELIRARREATA